MAGNNETKRIRKSAKIKVNLTIAEKEKLASYSSQHHCSVSEASRHLIRKGLGLERPEPLATKSVEYPKQLTLSGVLVSPDGVRLDFARVEHLHVDLPTGSRMDEKFQQPHRYCEGWFEFQPEWIKELAKDFGDVNLGVGEPLPGTVCPTCRSGKPLSFLEFIRVGGKSTGEVLTECMKCGERWRLPVSEALQGLVDEEAFKHSAARKRQEKQALDVQAVEHIRGLAGEHPPAKKEVVEPEVIEPEVVEPKAVAPGPSPDAEEAKEPSIVEEVFGDVATVSTDTLIQAVQGNSDPTVRKAAALALGDRTEKDEVEGVARALQMALSDGIGEVQGCAAASLEKVRKKIKYIPIDL